MQKTIGAVGSAVLTAGAIVALTIGPGSGADAASDPIQEAITASAAAGHHWVAESPTYAVFKQTNVPVRMADGTVLRADIATPANPSTGQPAPGQFPVLLAQSPYGKDTAGTVGSSAIGIDPYFVKRGYIDVVVDVRGTGASGGTFTLFDPKQTADGVALVKWAARLPHANGKVGLHGASYLGIDQLLTAGAVGPGSPLKAIFPVVSANDIYRDTSFMGGIPNSEFDLAYFGGLVPLVNLLNPVADALEYPANLLDEVSVLLQHLSNTLSANALFILETYFGGPQSYDTPFWHVRSPASVLSKIVANGIPAYLVGGEYDLFQRGAPMNFAGLQNAWAGRSPTAPMLAGQPTTGRYQLLDGPYTHATGAVSNSLNVLELEWFDTWLRGADTGMAQTRTPLHYFDLGTGHYAQSATYPIAGATPNTYYFSGRRSDTALSQNDGTLTRAKPVTTTAADRVSWAPIGSSICDRSVDQWAIGVLSAATDQLALPTPVPCFDDDRLGQTGPTALTYTTPAFARARTLAGPISATIYASANTAETEWVVNVEDVAPDGTSKPLTQGALLGSLRAVDASRSWRVDGATVMPYHPYTRLSAVPVRKGAVTRYDIEIFPTYSTIAAGHRIRVTVNTTDFPHLTPSPAAIGKLWGGTYNVQRTATAASSVTLPLIG